MRFGVLISKSAAPGVDLVSEARHAEALGFDIVTIHPDHLHGADPSLETWTALTWIAAHTSRVGIAPCVLSLPYRHPAIVAKMAETLDRLSGGRLVLAVGAGEDRWFGSFKAFGLAQRSPAQRVQAIEEAVDIIRGLWAHENYSYRGTHFSLAEANIAPKPGHPIPLWLGAFGPKMLNLTARKADGWLPSMFLLDPKTAARRLGELRETANRAGRDPDELTYGYNVPVLVQEHATTTDRLIAGSPDELGERLGDLGTQGFTFLNLWPQGEGAEQRERLAKEVLPALRAHTLPG